MLLTTNMLVVRMENQIQKIKEKKMINLENATQPQIEVQIGKEIEKFLEEFFQKMEHDCDKFEYVNLLGATHCKMCEVVYQKLYIQFLFYARQFEHYAKAK